MLWASGRYSSSTKEQRPLNSRGDKAIPWHKPTQKDRTYGRIENQEGTKSVRKKSEKMIEDAVLHNTLPHLYNLQDERRSKICNLRESAAYGKQT